jgi:uncharacterized membrane protein
VSYPDLLRCPFHLPQPLFPGTLSRETIIQKGETIMAHITCKEFLKKKGVNITVRTYLIDALGAMAFGLFASLLIGTIFGTLGEKTQITLFNTIAEYCKSATGAALGVSIAYALHAPQLVLFSAATVGIAGNALGGPVGALVSTVISTELGKLVSKETRVDILVTPGVTIISGVLMAQFVGPGVSAFMTAFGNLVKTATEMQPFFMGILVSALIGIALTLPISSAAICIMLSLDGLAGGAATAGCCAQMIGFAILSFGENGIGGLLAQGLGTSMLQMGNIVKNPRTWIPPTLASMVTGPVATCLFRMENIPAGSGMGTCGMVGPIGVYTAMGGGASMWLGILLVCFLLPAVLTWIFGEILRKLQWIRPGDLKLDL